MKKTILASALISLMAFTACQKDELSGDISDGSLASVAGLIEKDATLDDVMEATDYEIDYFTGSSLIVGDLSLAESGLKSGFQFRFGYRYRENACPLISFEKSDTTESGFPIVITVDYGDSTVLMNGRVISGAIEIIISDPRGADGRKREVNFVDYVVDSVSIAGGSVIMYNGPTDEENGKFTVTREVTCTFADGSYVTRSAEKVREWVSGFDTKWNPSDDIIHISGHSSSDDSEGNSYSKVIAGELGYLVKTGECREITAGVVEITKNGELVAVIDYGDGECDGVGTVTKGDEVKEITFGRGCKMKK
jgi:hypothetical protein